MNQRPVPDLTNLLPAGEWADIEILNSTPGLMTKRNWAIFARARWLRKGGREAFLKFLLPAGDQAGPDTQLVLSESRLGELKVRLELLQAMDETVPLVKLLRVEQIANGLLIAMDFVTPLNDLIDEGRSRDFSLRLLRDLDPEKVVPLRWLHFDICPLNIGVSKNGKCVFIDPESMYPIEESEFELSVPAWKPFRAPKSLADAVFDALGAERCIDQPLAIKKMRYEISLAAAECVLGRLPKGILPQGDAALDVWLSSFNTADGMVDFWVKELRSMARGGVARPLHEIAKDLAMVPAVGKVPLPSLMSALPDEGPKMASEHPPDKGSEAASFSSGSGEWEEAWGGLQSRAIALRTGKLHGDQLIAYRADLEELTSKFGSERDLWLELMLVLISYFKDLEASWAAITKALACLPGHPELVRYRNLIHKCLQTPQVNRHGS